RVSAIMPQGLVERIQRQQSMEYSKVFSGKTLAKFVSEDLSVDQRLKRVQAYIGRVKSKLTDIENASSETQKNIRYFNARPFTTPTGYFGAGLIVCGVDPEKEFTVHFNTYNLIPHYCLAQSRPQN